MSDIVDKKKESRLSELPAWLRDACDKYPHLKIHVQRAAGNLDTYEPYLMNRETGRVFRNDDAGTLQRNKDMIGISKKEYAEVHAKELELESARKQRGAKPLVEGANAPAKAQAQTPPAPGTEGPPAPDGDADGEPQVLTPAEVKADIKAMSGAKLDKFCAKHNITVPDGITKLKDAKAHVYAHLDL